MLPSKKDSRLPGFIPSPGRMLLLVTARTLIGTVLMAAPAFAQTTRVTAIPASDVFSIRVVGDTIVAGADTATFVSTNAGITWRMSSRPSSDAKIIDAVVMRNGRLYAGTFGTGVFVSDDLGATWQSFNQGLEGGILDSQFDISDLEPQGDNLLASTQGAGVWIRNLAGPGGWQPFGDAFEPNQAPNVTDLALGGTRLLACAGENGTTFRRDPGDADWTVDLLGNTTLLPGIGATTALFTGARWVVGTNFGVFLSATGQEPWTRSSTRLGTLSWATFAKIGGTISAAFDSVDTILMAESNDEGTTWQIRERVGDSFAYQLAVHGADLLIARSDGLFVQKAATASVGNELDGSPLRFALAGAQPVRNLARFSFDLPVGASAKLEVFDVTGRRATNEIDGYWPAGQHEVTVDARPLPPGVYAARLTSGSAQKTARFVLVR